MAGTRQIGSVIIPAGTTTTSYIAVDGEVSFISPSPAGSLIRWSGSYGNFIFKHASAPGVGKSFTYTLVKNGTDTAAVLVLSGLDTEVRYTGSVSCASGDRLLWRRDSAGSPTTSIVRYVFELAHATAYVTGYTGSGGANGSLTYYAPLFLPAITSTLFSEHMVSAPGDLVEIAYSLETAPGVGTSWEFALYIDGVKQTGAGGSAGSVDTRATVSGASTSGLFTGSVTLTAGMLVALGATPTSSPANSGVHIAVTIISAVDGESNLSGIHRSGIGTCFLEPQGTAIEASLTESDVEVIGGVSSFDLYGMRVSAISGSALTWITRKNASTPAGTPTCTPASGVAGSDGSGVVAIADGDDWCLSFSGSGIGPAQIGKWSWTQFALSNPNPIVGSFVIGANGTVTASRNGLVNLDGVTRTVHEPGTLVIGAKLKVLGETTIEGAMIGFTEVSVSSAELLALRATPKTLVAAPGAGKVLDFVEAVLLHDAATAYVESAANLGIKYENGSGAQVSETLDVTGFIDQTADTMAKMGPAAPAPIAKSACENKALVLHQLGAAEWTTGTGTLRVRITHRTWNTGW